MNDITREQAGQIWDLESYKDVTGAKRFKRTKEEMTLGLSPEESLQRRLDQFRDNKATRSVDHPIGEPPRVRASVSKKGEITIRIRAAAGTDTDYFEHVPDQTVEITLDQNWYGWYDTLAKCPFDFDIQQLITLILDEGIGEVLTKYHFPSDLPKS